MTFRRRQLFGWATLAAAALVCGAWLLRLDYAARISTDVLDLIPTAERAPELALVRELASETEARTMFFVLSGANGAPVPAEAGALFAAELVKSGAFEQALSPSDPAIGEAIGHELFDRRFTLLFPGWLDAHQPASTPDLARTAAAELKRFLATPEALVFEELIPRDPLLLLPKLYLNVGAALAPPADGTEAVPPKLESGGASAAPTAGFLGSAERERPDDSARSHSPLLIWARLSAPPLTEAGQGPAFAAIAAATAAVQAKFPGVAVADTGVNRFAAASRARIEKEVSLLNTLSLFAVLVVAFVFLRSAWRSLHLAPILALSMLGAWSCVTFAFPRVHIMVFAVGSLLAGVAVDYGFYLYMQPPLRPGEPYADKVRRLLKPLLASCFTTVAGFALLLFSDLPLIRQLGLFVGAGLLCALGGSIVYFATISNPYLEARKLTHLPRFNAGGRLWIRRGLIALWIFALPGLFRLTWRDDIRQLDIPSPALQANDRRIRELFGQTPDRVAYLTYGPSLAAARESVAAFEQWLQRETPGGAARPIGLAAALPTVAQQARAVKFLREETEFPARLRVALRDDGFEVDAFAPFFEAYQQSAAGAREEDLAAATDAVLAKLQGPMGMLVHKGENLSWFVSVASQAPLQPPPPETHTVAASQLQTMNDLFSRYRAGALKLSLLGLALVGAGVLATYGLRDGVRIFAIPCGACLGLFGLLGWLGLPLNLFHLLGAFLGVCLTHNYSIFSVTSAYRCEPPPISVRLSALTAAASFGVLTLSGIPVVRALGSTVALMVLAALLVIEFEHFAPIARKK